MGVSIITPTYNRVNLLPKVYESLKKQTSKDFEWIIVDDGSTDSTSQLVQTWLNEKNIDILYYPKENGGKHTAVNEGVIHAHQELVLVLDSDDALTDDAVEIILKDANTYLDNKKIAGLSYNKTLLNAPNKTKQMEMDTCISNHIEFRYNQGYIADRAEVYKTEILKKYPFPVFDGERFLSEACVWNQIAYEYDTVYINKSIYIAEYQTDGLTRNSIKARVNNPLGAVENYTIMMKKPFSLKLRIKYSILYNAFYTFASIKEKSRFANGNKILVFLTMPLGAYVHHKWKKEVNAS